MPREVTGICPFMDGNRRRPPDRRPVRRRRVGVFARRCALFIACVYWRGPDPAWGWRKSPRCNMTTEFECKTGHCIPVDQVCNRHPDCVDGSDESDCHCVQTWLPPMHRCRNKKCVDDFYTCNGKDDCGDGGSDEENCACYGFRCADGTCILSTWRCDGYKDCKDYSDEENCGTLLAGDRRHPFLGLIGPVGCLVAALSIRVLLRSHQRRRLLHSNGETAAAAAAAVAALEARNNRRARFIDDPGGAFGSGGAPGGGGGGVDRLDDSLEAGLSGSQCDRLASTHWMDRVGAGISSSIAQMRILFTPGGQQSASLPPPPPYTEATTLTDLPPAYQRGAASAATGIPSVYLLVIPAGKPPPSYNESMSLPDLVQSTGNASQRIDGSPTGSNHFVPISSEDPLSSTRAQLTGFAPSSSTPDSASTTESRQRSAVYSSSSTPYAFYSANNNNNNNNDDAPLAGDDDDEFPSNQALPSSAAPVLSSVGNDDTISSTGSEWEAADGSPHRGMFRPVSGVTLRQNPLSDEVIGREEVAVTFVEECDGQLTEELPPSYDDIFTGGEAPTASEESEMTEEEEEESISQWQPSDSPLSSPSDAQT